MEKEYKDIKIICKQCGKEFTFEAGQQKHFDSLGFEQPKYCIDCRAARKVAKELQNNEKNSN